MEIKTLDTDSLKIIYLGAPSGKISYMTRIYMSRDKQLF